jgi:hypothetical protein
MRSKCKPFRCSFRCTIGKKPITNRFGSAGNAGTVPVAILFAHDAAGVVPNIR